MQVNNSEVDLTLADIQEKPSTDDHNPDHRTLEDDIAISQAVNEAEEELKSSSGSGEFLQNMFYFGVAVAGAALFLNQFDGFAFLKQ